MEKEEGIAFLEEEQKLDWAPVAYSDQRYLMLVTKTAGEFLKKFTKLYVKNKDMSGKMFFPDLVVTLAIFVDFQIRSIEQQLQGSFDTRGMFLEALNALQAPGTVITQPQEKDNDVRG
jgi:uncharacterized protein YfaT (DUF1175 family)